MVEGARSTGVWLSGKDWIGWLLVWVLAASLAPAQLPTATVLGVVRDATGAVVPGVNLTARSTETGQTRTAVSAGDGSFRFPALPVGNYEVRVEQSGFQTAVRSGLTLAVAQEAVVNFALEVGAVTQTVEVTGEAPLVNTTSGSVGAMVGERTVAELPLNGRNFIALTLLQTGVQESPYARSDSIRWGIWFSSNGAPLRSNNYLLDGAPMIGVYGGSAATPTGNSLGVEGIREWRVITNSFSAEYGMSMGSQMVVVTKSGTNSFHGSLFEYLRNSALDARNFFDYKTAATPRRLPSFTRNNFGASLGGPIRQDKTFFYATYEGLRERVGVTSIMHTIPRAAKVDGGLVPQINPAIKPVLAAFPDPNLPNDDYTFPYSQPTRDDYGQMRVDQSFSDKDTLFARYTIAEGFREPLVNYLELRAPRVGRNQFVTLSESHVFSPALLSTIRASFSRMTDWGETTGRTLLGSEAWFMPNLRFGTTSGLGAISIGGLSAWGPHQGRPHEYKKNTWVYSGDLFYTRGRHALKFGALISRIHYGILNTFQTRGIVAFATPTSFLLGQPQTIRAAVPNILSHRSYRNNVLGFYLQDDLRVASNLMLNLGLRYEPTTELQETLGRAAPLKDVLRDDRTTVGKQVAKNNSLRNFSPRFGFAWDVRGDGRTAVRGGFALLYDVGNQMGAQIQGICSPPFCDNATISNPPPFRTTLAVTFPAGVLGKTIQNLDFLQPQPRMLHYNLTVERQLPWEMAVNLAYVASRGIHIMQPKEGNPTVPLVRDGRKYWAGNEPRVNPNWNDFFMYGTDGNSWYNGLQFGLLKRLSKGLQFQSSYTWSKTIDDVQGQFTNEGGYVTDPRDRKVDRGLAEFDVRHNWQFNALYRLPDLVPAGGVPGNLLNGWGMKAILSLNTGYPVNPTLSYNRSRSLNWGGVSLDRPDLAPGVQVADITQGVSRGCGTGTGAIAAGTPLGDRWRWFDPCAFTLSTPGYLGTAGRNIIPGPGLANLDFSLTKDTPLRFLGESGKLEFRAEIFNILNRTNFFNPAGAVYSGRAAVENPLATVGRISSTRTTSRQIQLALKILF